MLSRIGSFEFNPKCCIKSGVMARACNASTREVKEGGSEIQGHLRLCGELKPARPMWDPVSKKRKQAGSRQAADWLEGRLVGLQAKQIHKDRNWIIFTKVEGSKEWWFLFNENSLCLRRHYIVEIDGGDGFMRMWIYSTTELYHYKWLKCPMHGLMQCLYFLSELFHIALSPVFMC